MIPFGKTLRDAREAKGISISQIAEATHMLSSIVQDLENEDFTRIVAPIYGRGFVKLYCEVVGIDPKPLIAEFMDIYNGNRVPSIRERAPAASSAPAAAPTPVPPPAAAPTPVPPPAAAPIPAPAPVAAPIPAPPPIAAPIPAPAPVAAPPAAAPIPASPTVIEPQPTVPATPEAEPNLLLQTASRPEPAPAPEPPMPDIGPLFNPEPPPAAAEPPAPNPILAKPAPARPETADDEPQPVKRTISRYASPLSEPQAAPIKLPHISIPPQVWRISILAIVILAILFVLGLGVRALYRVTTDQNQNPPAEISVPSEDTASVPSTQPEPTPAAKPTEKAKPAEKAPAPTATADGKSPASAPRQPQKIPSLYID